MDREDNSFGDFQNNNDDSDKDEDGNAGDDTIYVYKLVWEDIENNLFIPYISDHYCGPHCFEEGVEKFFLTVLECIFRSPQTPTFRSPTLPSPT